MKRVMNFVAVLMTAMLCLGLNAASAQDTPIFSEDFTAVTESGTQQCSASGTAFTATTIENVLPGWTGTKAYPALGKIKLGTSSVNGSLTTPSIDLSNYGSVLISFDAKAWNTSNATQGTTMTVYVNSTAYTIENLPNVGSTDTTTEGFCDMQHYEILAAAGCPTTITFEGSPRAFIDNVAIYEATTAAISVQGNTTFNNVGVGEACSANLIAKGFNLTAGAVTDVMIAGDTQFSTTVTTLNNSDLMTDNGVVIPISFSADAAGSYAATIMLVNSDMTDTINVSLTANVIEVIDIPSLDQLRNLIDNSDITVNVTDSVYYRYVGHAYVTQCFKSGSYTKWIQDSTAAIQLYDPDGKLANVSEGQEITNVIGKLNNYYGYVEFAVQSSIATSDINPFPTTIPSPIVITLAQLQDQDFMDAIQGQLVKLENVTINATGTFTKFIRYEVSQGGVTDSAIYFTGSYDTQVGTSIPTTTVDIVGVNMFSAAYSAGYGTPRLAARYYVLPRDGWENSIVENDGLNVTVYPNPFEDNITIEMSETATNVAVYNMFGKMVANQSMSAGANTIQLQNLAAGMYIIRVFNDNEVIATAKIVRK